MVSHFEQRARERGVPECDYRALQIRIMLAIRNGSSEVEFVMMAREDSEIWRFFVQGSPFYVIVNANKWPKTILTQAMLTEARMVARGKATSVLNAKTRIAVAEADKRAKLTNRRKDKGFVPWK